MAGAVYQMVGTGDDHSSRIQSGRWFGLCHLIGLVVQSIAARGLLLRGGSRLTHKSNGVRHSCSVVGRILIKLIINITRILIYFLLSDSFNYPRGEGLVLGIAIEFISYLRSLSAYKLPSFQDYSSVDGYS